MDVCQRKPIGKPDKSGNGKRNHGSVDVSHVGRQVKAFENSRLTDNDFSRDLRSGQDHSSLELFIHGNGTEPGI